MVGTVITGGDSKPSDVRSTGSREVRGVFGGVEASLYILQDERRRGRRPRGERLSRD